MTAAIEQKIDRHRAFLERNQVDRPLIGCVRGWENLSRYTRDTESFFPLAISTLFLSNKYFKLNELATRIIRSGDKWGVIKSNDENNIEV